MMYGLSLRVSWICLLLFSSGSCFPAAKEDYKYPYTAALGSSGESGPRAFPSSEGSRVPLVNLQYGPSANYQQPGAAPQGPSAPIGNQSPSSVGAHSVLVGSSPSYEPNRFLVSSGSNTPISAPEVPSQGAGYVSPPGPASTGSLSMKPQSSGTSGQSSVGSGGVASSPAYGASPAYSANRYMAPTLDFGEGPVPYIGDPEAFNYGAGSFSNAGPAPETSSYGYYDAAPETSYGGGSDFDLAWAVQPVEASFSNPNDWMPDGVFPDFSVWGTGGNSQSQSKTKTIHTEEPSAVPSSTYLIQSGNGYIRARQFQSHTNYAPEDPETLVFVAEPRRVVTKTRPAAPPKGGKKI